MAEEKYLRLTRTRPRSVFGAAFISRTSLWLGSDHLLCIDTNGYSEKYKRFYFRDIQAVVLRQTRSWLVWSVVLGFVAAFLGLIALAVDDEIGYWILGGFAAFFLLSMVLSLAGGPSCRCYLRTAVQTEELASLSRLRKARKVWDRVRPLIAQAQGQLTPEEIPTRLQEWAASTSQPVAAVSNQARYVVDDPNAPPRILS